MSTAPKPIHNLEQEPNGNPSNWGPGPAPLVAIVGPTASGKSALGIRLASQFGGEILSCDSTQVYRGFDIGTAKPAVVERGDIPHHLLDLVDPGFPFTAGEFRLRALNVLEDLRRIRQVAELEAQRDGRVVAEHTDVPEVDVVGEADHAARPRVIEQEQRQPDAREEHEQGRREEQDRHR